MTEYFYIISLLTGADMALEATGTAQPVVNNPMIKDKNQADFQLWEKIPVERNGESFCFLRNKGNGEVLDINGGRALPDTLIITYPTNIDTPENQLWSLADEGGVYSINSLLNDLAVDVQGGNPKPGTPIIVYPEGQPPAANQLWFLYPA